MVMTLKTLEMVHKAMQISNFTVSTQTCGDVRYNVFFFVIIIAYLKKQRADFVIPLKLNTYSEKRDIVTPIHDHVWFESSELCLFTSFVS